MLRKIPFFGLLCATVAVIAGACATVSPRPPEPASLWRDASFRPTALPPVAEITVLSGDMRRYLASDIAEQLRSKGSLHGFVSALEKNTQLKLEYDATATRTAAEAFAARRGNCLSLTLMTAALARELGLAVSYRKVHVDEPWDRLNGLLVRSGHVNIVLEPNRMTEAWIGGRSKGVVVDFLPHADLARQRSAEIDEQTVLAMFMNNRAAESLVTADIDSAYSWARQAITTAPRYLDAYNTLGVIYLHRQLADAAQRAFETVLQQEDENVAAMANLVDALERQGNAGEATKWRQRLQRIEDRPPFYHYDQGIAALKAKDYATARDFFSRELARNAYYHAALFGLAVANIGMGEPRKAEGYLQQAIDASAPAREHDLYAAKLDWLRKARQDN
jgi:tetratricopeptide (TPR) repeat protein